MKYLASFRTTLKASRYMFRALALVLWLLIAFSSVFYIVNALHQRESEIRQEFNLSSDQAQRFIQRTSDVMKELKYIAENRLSAENGVLSPDLFHLRLRLFQQILSIEQDLSSLYRGRSRQKPHQRKAGHAFAAAGFTYDSQSLSFVQLHIQMVDQVVDLSVIVLKTHAVILELYLC